MIFSGIFILGLTAAIPIVAQRQDIKVPVPWWISDLTISNIRHGTGGTWQFNVVDSPTVSPQGFNTTCRYYSPTTYTFALDGAPINQACNDPSVTFSLYPNGNDGFTFNITHLWGDCGSNYAPQKCNDNGTWIFSKDDVRGQQSDVENNFGQYGGFGRAGLRMYPKRAVRSEKCMFC